MTKISMKRPALSIGILLASLGLAYTPFGSKQRIVVVSGTELQAPLSTLAARYQEQNPNVTIDLKFQGSQDIVNNVIDRKNAFDPVLIIPANGTLLETLETRLQAQGITAPFHRQPQPVAKTQLVAVAWPDRANTLFPSGQFRWNELEKALKGKNWETIGGKAQWGSFDFLMTDPTRSNSGQLTLALWAQATTKAPNLSTAFNQTTPIETLFSLIKKSVYQPPRSTDILLQEFISRGPNDADMATVYESIALKRWQSSKVTKGKPYQIFYPETTVETIATGTVLTQNTTSQERKQAERFLVFMRQTNQQHIFIQNGFRSIQSSINLADIEDSPWQQNIPGVILQGPSKILKSPKAPIITEIIKTWQRID